jgi:hypothetical protein
MYLPLQPLLDISSLNPYLYSRVPILLHVKETRIKLSKVLSCMCRHAHGKIEQAMGSRRYLLENNDLFALRDLEDLSKGAFSGKLSFSLYMREKKTENAGYLPKYSPNLP